MKFYDSNHAVSQASIKTTPGQLRQVDVYNSDTAVHFLQFYDQAVPVTGSGDHFVYCIPVPAGVTVSVQYGDFGRQFTRGIQWLDSTAETTPSGSNKLTFTAGYT